MARRWLALYFPAFSLDQCLRKAPLPSGQLFAITREDRGHLLIAERNEPAAKAGIACGMRLADARALAPALEAIPIDRAADREAKERLLDWLNRYTPAVAFDDTDNLALDITGCGHLFGGEEDLRSDLESRIRRSGLRVRSAIAGTLGAAWAMARYSIRKSIHAEETAEALDPLPVAGLRLDPDTVDCLHRVGISTIGMLRQIPRLALASRFGEGILLRLDQAMGAAEEVLDRHQSPVPLTAQRVFPEPLGTFESVEYVLNDLLKEVCGRLEKNHQGVRELVLACHRVDGVVLECPVNATRPLNSVKRWRRLFDEKLDNLELDFGIEAMILHARILEDTSPRQMNLPGLGKEQNLDSETELDALIDRIGARLGFEKIRQYAIRESYLPEYSVENLPILSKRTKNTDWPAWCVRPVYLVDPPVALQAMAGVPDEPPLRFWLYGKPHIVIRREGPERLTPEWWREVRLPWKTRDYYRLEDEAGERFWVFREGRYRFHEPPRWFLHGYFA